MKVVILCGGKGTRLKEKTESLPKPLIEIGGRAILWHIMKIYAAHGFTDFVLCLGYKAQMIKEYFRESEGWAITFADTGEETNTGGRIKLIEKYIDGEDFMVTYGDGVSDIDIKKLVAFHKAHGHIGTVTAVNPPSQFGLLDIDSSGAVKRFREKPVTDRWINGGFFVFKKDFFKYLNADDILEKKPLEAISEEGHLRAYKHESFWKCMDTYKDTLSLNEVWSTGKAPWKIW
jgi:glucose-1-phosphate cytidylyltransferase